MVQMISETVEGGAPAEADLRDAAAGGGGDAGGGGRDDARVAELTKLLCTVHDMSSQVSSTTVCIVHMPWSDSLNISNEKRMCV